MEEIVISLDDVTHEAVIVVHWIGGRHTTSRVRRRRAGGYPSLPKPDAVEVMRKLGGRWPDRELAVTLNRMRCKTPDGETWTTVRAAELRQRLGIPEYSRGPDRPETISADAAARKLGIAIQSVHRLIRDGIIPASQVMHSAPWEIPAAALQSEAVRIGVQAVIARRPILALEKQGENSLRLPGI